MCRIKYMGYQALRWQGGVKAVRGKFEEGRRGGRG